MKRFRSRGKPEYQLRIARERIQILFKEADEIASKDISLANRYVELARKIGMRFNIRLPRELKRKFCRKCYCYLKPGVTSKHRTKKGFVEIICKNCGHVNRYPLKK